MEKELETNPKRDQAKNVRVKLGFSKKSNKNALVHNKGVFRSLTKK